MTPLLSVHELTFSYTKEAILQDLSFTLSGDSQRIALLGPDGAGKSTLLKLIARLLHPQQGEILPSVCKAPPGFNAFCAFMPQQLGLYDELTVAENLELFAALHGLKDEGKAEFLRHLLQVTGLLPFSTRRAGNLSGGMRQKLALCTMLCAKPYLLILDEPTVGVDPLSRQELWALLQDYLQSSGAHLIFSTAYLSEAQTADEILILESGRLIYHGHCTELIHSVRDCCFTLYLPESLPKLLQQALLSLMTLPELICDVSPWGGALRLQTNTPQSIASLSASLRTLFASFRLEVRKPSLEDAYIRLTLGKLQPLTPPQAPSFALNDPAVELKGVVKRFGKFTALHHSTFSVRRGEIFGLLGPNGAGKTTTFRLMCSLLRPSGGEIKLNGLNIGKQKSAARLQLGYVAQRFSLYKKLTVRQNLAYFGQSCALAGTVLEARIQELASEYNLDDKLDTPAGLLSFGLQRNLAMAVALLARPALLFLDEATSGADPRSRRIFWQRILSLAATGTTVVVTTHFLEEAEYCDRFLIQHEGRILVCGTPSEICTGSEGRISVEERFIKLIVAARGRGEA